MTVERDYCCFLHVQRIQNMEKLHKKNVIDSIENKSIDGNQIGLAIR
jgi:hypothetical protein